MLEFAPPLDANLGVLSGSKVTLDLLAQASGPNLKAFADLLVEQRLSEERIDADEVVAAIAKAVAAKRSATRGGGKPRGGNKSRILSSTDLELLAQISSSIKEKKDQGRGKSLRCLLYSIAMLTV